MENNLEILRHILNYNNEAAFENLACLIFSMGNPGTTFLDSDFQTEDHRSNWERAATDFFRGCIRYFPTQILTHYRS